MDIAMFNKIILTLLIIIIIIIIITITHQESGSTNRLLASLHLSADGGE
jgi:hypothetical protein